jgi:hypothetical protein
MRVRGLGSPSYVCSETVVMITASERSLAAAAAVPKLEGGERTACCLTAAAANDRRGGVLCNCPALPLPSLRARLILSRDITICSIPC